MPPVVEDVPPLLNEMFARNRAASEYVGLQREVAQNLAADSGVNDVRVLSLDARSLSWHSDHRANRLNLLILGGTVVRAAFF